MGAKITYTDEPMDDIRVVADFFPFPEELALREESVKVTISLNKKSVELFKSETARHHIQYQRMIRQLRDSFADVQSQQRPTGRSKNGAPVNGPLWAGLTFKYSHLQSLHDI